MVISTLRRPADRLHAVSQFEEKQALGAYLGHPVPSRGLEPIRGGATRVRR
ncbi:MAG: hypothetical protein QOF90_2355 [Acetobacteraceae bacterium]|jgi:hypothetical protein|nr:hypothetical protein [Acetobacteraceae bacterium]MEA2790595.1 hypothetical protein [Acetobacteraceae bacterium]